MRAPEPVWTRWRREIISAPSGKQTLVVQRILNTKLRGTLFEKYLATGLVGCGS